ncbi:MAG: hypothetical protein RhofKO_28140 [Rhodothermales bacterium]
MKREVRKYAPIWVILFSTFATLLKSSGQRYLTRSRVKLTWKDLATAVVGAVLGYVTFRMKQGDHSSEWYKR